LRPRVAASRHIEPVVAAGFVYDGRSRTAMRCDAVRGGMDERARGGADDVATVRREARVASHANGNDTAG